jgi:hypothetical protein
METKSDKNTDNKIKSILSDMTELGTGILAKLDRQTGQIKTLDRDTDQISQYTTRSRQLLRSIGSMFNVIKFDKFISEKEPIDIKKKEPLLEPDTDLDEIEQSLARLKSIAQCMNETLTEQSEHLDIVTDRVDDLSGELDSLTKKAKKLTR